jgi:hypothetical protein
MSLVSCLLYKKKAKQLKHVLQMLFPQLIIYRVAEGSAWTEKTAQELTQATGSLVFAPCATNTAMLDSEANVANNMIALAALCGRNRIRAEL